MNEDTGGNTVFILYASSLIYNGQKYVETSSCMDGKESRQVEWLHPQMEKRTSRISDAQPAAKAWNYGSGVPVII